MSLMTSSAFFMRGMHRVAALCRASIHAMIRDTTGNRGAARRAPRRRASRSESEHRDHVDRTRIDIVRIEPLVLAAQSDARPFVLNAARHRDAAVGALE